MKNTILMCVLLVFIYGCNRKERTCAQMIVQIPNEINSKSETENSIRDGEDLFFVTELFKYDSVLTKVLSETKNKISVNTARENIETNILNEAARTIEIRYYSSNSDSAKIFLELLFQKTIEEYGRIKKAPLEAQLILINKNLDIKMNLLLRLETQIKKGGKMKTLNNDTIALFNLTEKEYTDLINKKMELSIKKAGYLPTINVIEKVKFIR